MTLLPEVSLGSSQWHYGAILDAGSTSTKVKIYRWPPRTSLDTVLKIAQVGKVHKESPGISNFVHNLTALDDYIGQLVSKVKESIPESVHSTTSLYLLATAGKFILFDKHSNKHNYFFFLICNKLYCKIKE